MPLSTDVTLPKFAVPTFPDRCINCGTPKPGSHVRVGTNAIGWGTLVFWHPGRRFSVAVPACELCRRRLVRRRWSRRVLEWSIGLMGVAAAFYLLGSYRGPFKRWLALGIALGCLLPWFIWQSLFPPPIDLTAYSDTVQYEFRDADYADEFVSLNV